MKLSNTGYKTYLASTKQQSSINPISYFIELVESTPRLITLNFSSIDLKGDWIQALNILDFRQMLQAISKC